MNIFFYIWKDFLIICVRYNLYADSVINAINSTDGTHIDRNQTFYLRQSLLRHCNFTINDCTNSSDVIFLLSYSRIFLNRFIIGEISSKRKMLISLRVYIYFFFFFNIIS